MKNPFRRRYRVVRKVAGVPMSLGRRWTLSAAYALARKNSWPATNDVEIERT